MVPVDSLLSESRLNEVVLPSFDFSRFVTYASSRPESLPPVARFAGRTMSSCQKLESMGGNAICWIDRHGPIRDDASVVCMVPVDSLLSESRLDEAVLASFDFSRFVPSLLGGNSRL